MRRKGVCYDVGRVIGGRHQRPVFDEEVVRRELRIIAEDLHCTAVRIGGEDVGRVVTAGRAALEQGLEAWLSPELFDHTAEETLDHLAEAAAAVEELRREWPDRVVLTVGAELTLFMRGILPGGTVLDRIGNPLRLAAYLLRLKLLGSHNEPLNHFLGQAAALARERFHGPITYASAPIEAVDWTPFDLVGVDYYRGKQNRTTYGQRLGRYTALGKPVVITEVGCCTYRGAEDRGGRAFMIFDRKRPETVKPGHVRDEDLQAHELVDMLRVLDASAVDGAFAFTFSSPTLPHSPDPVHDLDMASYSLVKTLPDGTGGTVLSWEPKQSFHALADFYR